MERFLLAASGKIMQSSRFSAALGRQEDCTATTRAVTQGFDGPGSSRGSLNPPFTTKQGPR